MSVVVEITNTANLKRAKKLLGAKSDGETLELALEKVIQVYEPAKGLPHGDLPDEYWDDLFSEPPIESKLVDKALREDREDRV